MAASASGADVPAENTPPDIQNTPIIESDLPGEPNLADSAPPRKDSPTRGRWYAALRFYPRARVTGKEYKLKPFVKHFGPLDSTGALYVGRGYRRKDSGEDYTLAVSSKSRDFLPFYDLCTIMHTVDSQGSSSWQISGSGTVLNASVGFKVPMVPLEWIRLSDGAEVSILSKSYLFLKYRADLHFHVEHLELLVVDSKIVEERKPPNLSS